MRRENGLFNAVNTLFPRGYNTDNKPWKLYPKMVIQRVLKCVGLTRLTDNTWANTCTERTLRAHRVTCWNKLQTMGKRSFLGSLVTGGGGDTVSNKF